MLRELRYIDRKLRGIFRKCDSGPEITFREYNVVNVLSLSG